MFTTYLLKSMAVWLFCFMVAFAPTLGAEEDHDHDHHEDEQAEKEAPKLTNMNRILTTSTSDSLHIGQG